MGNPVGAEEGNNSSQEEREASSETAWNSWLRQKRAGGMMRSGRPEVILHECLRGSQTASRSACEGC